MREFLLAVMELKSLLHGIGTKTGSKKPKRS